jgi:hypothetical protein
MGIGTYAQEYLLNCALRNTAFSRPATFYVSLHTADPTDAGTGAEVSGGSYARMPLNTGASSEFSAAASGSGGMQCTNTPDLDFPQATAAWGTITHVALWDDDGSPVGNMWFYGPLAASKVIGINDYFSINAGDLKAIIKSPA